MKLEKATELIARLIQEAKAKGKSSVNLQYLNSRLIFRSHPIGVEDIKEIAIPHININGMAATEDLLLEEISDEQYYEKAQSLVNELIREIEFSKKSYP